jgi:translation initiation factor IF-2
VRDHVVVHSGKIGSLRRFKEDAREVQSGYECGIGLENFQDIKAGDVIEVFETERVARRLSPPGAKSTGVERRI